MTTATTTLAEIRAHQRLVLKQLIPEAHASDRFRPHVEGTDLREWAEAHPNAAFRVFDVLDTFNYTLPEISTDVESWRGRMELVVAYPKHFAKYGSDYAGDLASLLVEDYKQIDSAIGVHGAGNYLPGQLGMIEPEVDLEEGANVVLLRARWWCEFRCRRLTIEVSDEPPPAASLTELALPLDPATEGGPTLSGAAIYAEAGSGLPARLTRVGMIVVEDVFGTLGSGTRGGMDMLDNEHVVTTNRTITATDPPRLVRVIALATGSVVDSWELPGAAVPGKPLTADGEAWVPERDGAAYHRYSPDGTLLASVTLDPAPGSVIDNWCKVPGADRIWVQTGATNTFSEYVATTGAGTGRSVNVGNAGRVAATATHLYAGRIIATGNRLRAWDLADLSIAYLMPQSVRQLPGGGISSCTAMPWVAPNGNIYIAQQGGGVDEFTPDLTLIRRLATSPTSGEEGFAASLSDDAQGPPLVVTADGRYACTLHATADEVANGVKDLAIHRIDDAIAEWEIEAAEKARTLRTVAVPGALGVGVGTEIDARHSKLEVRVNVGAWVEYEFGEFIGEDVPAGSTAGIRVTLLSPLGKPQSPPPYIGVRTIGAPEVITVSLGVSS